VGSGDTGEQIIVPKLITQDECDYILGYV